ncbi:hypothetical protein [[Eubacterium] cellulosolvens]
MEATVRYIPIEIGVSDGQEFAVGNKPALCFRGKEYALGIVNGEEGIIPVRLTLRQHDESPLILINNRTDEYPVSKFIAHLQRIMVDKPIAEEALKLISNWPNNGEDFNSEPIPDHPVITAIKRAKVQKSNCIPVVAKEYETTPQKIRKYLRSRGMHAPYDNETEIRSIMKTFNKE